MTTTINAVSGNNLQVSADGSGIVKLQSNGITTNALAWVNWNGVTTATIRSSYNVSSVTRNSAGDYTVNFTTAMSDANYCITGSAGGGVSNGVPRVIGPSNANPTVSALRVVVTSDFATASDIAYCSIAIFGN